ncbi:hypothetical protein [Streptomyces cyaneofuscatus]|uniref:hypothetical protein n=1 Tax=Streptomyces cyaneofuscatus TaxID=66883 RepID=UPI00339F9373
MPVTAEPDPPDYRQDLVAHAESLAIMRRIVSAHVDLWGFRELADSVTLSAHELLANGVAEHFGTVIRRDSKDVWAEILTSRPAALA